MLFTYSGLLLGSVIKHYIIIIDKISEMMKTINNDALEIEVIYKDYEAKKRELMKRKITLSRLYVEAQKQS